MRGRHDRRDVRVGEDEPDAISGGWWCRPGGRPHPPRGFRTPRPRTRASGPGTPRHRLLGRPPPHGEPGREAARPPHELGIGQRACRVGDGDAVRISRRAGSDQGADGSKRRIGARQVRVFERVDRREIRRRGSPQELAKNQLYAPPDKPDLPAEAPSLRFPARRVPSITADPTHRAATPLGSRPIVRYELTVDTGLVDSKRKELRKRHAAWRPRCSTWSSRRPPILNDPPLRAIAKPSTISSTHDVRRREHRRSHASPNAIAARFARAIESAQRAHPGRAHLTLPAAGDRVDPLRRHPGRQPTAATVTVRWMSWPAGPGSARRRRR